MVIKKLAFDFHFSLQTTNRKPDPNTIEVERSI